MSETYEQIVKRWQEKKLDTVEDGEQMVKTWERKPVSRRTLSEQLGETE